jgi:hypothetical protein
MDLRVFIDDSKTKHRDSHLHVFQHAKIIYGLEKGYKMTTKMSKPTKAKPSPLTKTATKSSLPVKKTKTPVTKSVIGKVSKTTTKKAAPAASASKPVIKKEVVEDTSSFGKCIFKPLRSNQKVCTSDATTAWGFCARHSRTKQGKTLQEEYEKEEQSKYDAEMRELEKELESLYVSDEESEDEDAESEENEDDSEDDWVPEKKKEKKIVISQNKWGKFEEKETGIVFNADTRFAHGIQEPDGTVSDLTRKAIKICIERGWPYMEPKNIREEESDSEEENEEGESEEENEEGENEEDKDEKGRKRNSEESDHDESWRPKGGRKQAFVAEGEKSEEEHKEDMDHESQEETKTGKNKKKKGKGKEDVESDNEEEEKDEDEEEETKDLSEDDEESVVDDHDSSSEGGDNIEEDSD